MARQLHCFLREDEGMEVLEWAIVGAVLGLACFVFWQDLSRELRGVLHLIGAPRWAAALR